MHILVELDGVIRTKDDGIISTGVLMYSMLTAYNRMTIMSASSEQETLRFLNVNKIVDVDNIIDSSVSLEGEDLAERQITFARGSGAIDLFITSNPKLWAFAFDLGITSIMFGVPSYIRPEFRPDAPKKVRSRDSNTEAIDRQNEARVKDLRLTRNNGVSFEK
jgi:hypothetical protein